MELVITMPALLLAVLAVIQFGLWMHAQHVAFAAAQDGARAARAYGGGDQLARDRVQASIARLGPTILREPSVEVVRTTQEVTVTVSARAASVLGVFVLPVHERASGPIERFVSAGQGAP